MTDKQVFSSPPILSGSKRIYWVDTAKALGIFLVFWGHILYGGGRLADIINRAIYSFHMPMYFILSGYVLKPDFKSFGVYMRNKFDRILLPALIVYVLTIPLYFFSQDFSTATLGSVLRAIFYFDGKCAYNKPIWFFFCLFEVYILTKFLKLGEADNKKLMIIVLTSLLLSFLLYSLKWAVFNTFGFNKCILGLFFVSIGVAMKRFFQKNRIEKVGLIALPFWFLTGVILNNKVSMGGMSLGNFWLFILSAITGSLSFFALSKLIENSERVREYAKWSIFIICSHFVLVSGFYRFSGIIGFGGSFYFDITSVIFVLLSLSIYKPVCVLIDNNIPILMGKKKVCKQ